MKAYKRLQDSPRQQPVKPLILGSLILLGSVAVQAADVNEYGVLKGKRYSQIEAGTPSEDYTAYGWSGYVWMSAEDAVSTASAQPPGLSALPLLEQDNPRFLQLEIMVAQTVEILNLTFPNGDHVVAMETANDGSKSITMSLTGDSYPNTPTFLNYAALATVDSSEDYPLSWSSFSGGTANDFIQVQIVDDSGNEVFITSSLGKVGALTGTATSLIIPANTLLPDDFYTVNLTFTKVVTLDTSSYAGATGLAGYYKSTSVQLGTSTGSGGGDTTPPELISSVPGIGQFNVAVTSPITFVFNEAMMNSQSISWSSNINSADFTYSWSGDHRTLTCTYNELLPVTALVTWSLNPSGQPLNFKDEAGNPLPEDVYSGSFFTDSGTNNLCGVDDNGRGSGGLVKELIYVQSSEAAPSPDPMTPAVFLGIATSPTNNPILTANLQVPGGPLLALTNFTGLGRAFIVSEDYASQSALDTARPNATYNLQLTRTTGAPPSANISLSGSYPATPHIQNYAACQTVDPAADFTVQWNGISGAGTGDYVSFSLLHPTTTWQWSAPDPCVPRTLSNTATSVTIPANTLEPGITYEASLVYSRMTHSVSNGIPDIDLVGYLHKTVNFTVQTTGSGGGSGARFIGWRLLSTGNFELQLEGTIGITYAIETTDSLLDDWSIFSAQVIPFGGVATFEVSISGQQAFFRASPF